MSLDKLPVFERFPDVQKEQSRLILWIKNNIYVPISRRVNFLLSLVNSGYVEIPADDVDPGTDGNWRWRHDGTDLVLEHKVSGAWVEKDIKCLADGTVKLGDVDGTDYTEIEADGTVEFNGAAVVWDDWQGPLASNQRVNPSAHIVANDAEASVTFKTNCDLGDYVYMVPQMPHKWKLGTAIDPHLHWWQTTAAMPNWLIQYRWQMNSQAKTTAWTYVPLTTNIYTWVSGTLCQITEGADITPPANYSISDLVQFRVLRDVANASGEFAGAEAASVDADAVSFDYHYMIDTVGSREEFTK